MPTHKGIYYSDRGAGPVVLLIHGFCESHRVWASIIPMLENFSRIIAVDVPGFGASDLPAKDFSISSIAQDLVAFMSEIGVATYSVIGHSMGGYIALEMARQASHSIKRLSLFHSTALPDTEEKKLSRNKVIDFIERNGVPQFIESFIPLLFHDRNHPAVSMLVKEASLTRLETVVRYTAAMRDRLDGTEVLREFQRPILFIAGSHDPGIPVESLHQQALMSQKPVFSVAEGVAHMGMLENPPMTAEILVQFLKVSI